MKLIIDIPDKDYTKLKEGHIPFSILEVIKNGVPLPKGHGRIVDISKIEYLKALHDAKYGEIPWSEAIERIKNSAPTIIEADKAKSEENAITFNNLCNSCTNIGCEFQSGIVRTECAFYMPPHIESDNCGNYIVQHKPKTGHWKHIRCDMYECSKCQHIYTDLSGEKQGMNFCPNCGAKMVDEQETETWSGIHVQIIAPKGIDKHIGEQQ